MCLLLPPGDAAGGGGVFEDWVGGGDGDNFEEAGDAGVVAEEEGCSAWTRRTTSVIGGEGVTCMTAFLKDAAVAARSEEGVGNAASNAS
jgi:hypothetical protein